MASWYNEGIGNKIAKFVEQPGHSAVDIIQDSDVMAEFKKLNPKLIEYFGNNQAILDELIEYVSQLPSPAESELRVYKLPMYACELLETIEPLIKSIFESQTSCRLTKFFKLLSSEAAIQSMLPSYFSRVFEVMCSAKYHDSVVKYLKENPQVIEQMLQHSGNPSIAKCIKILVLVDDKDSYGDIDNWSGFKQGILDRAFKMIENGPARDPFLAENILDLYSDVVQRNLVIYHKNDLLSTILEPNKVQTYFSIAAKSDDLATYALRLLGDVFMHLKKIQGLQIAKNLQAFLDIYASKIAQIIGQLSRPTLKVVELLQVVIQSLRINRRIFPESCYPVFNSLFKLFSEFPQSNILHSKLDRLIYVAFEQEVNQPLVDYLFRDFDIINRTIVGVEYSDRYRSNFGYQIRIARHFTSFKVLTPEMSAAIQKNKDLWTNFSKAVLEPYQAAVTKDLGSYTLEDKDNTNNTGLYTIKSFVTNKIEPNKFKESTCIEQAPSSLISLDFMNSAAEPAQQNNFNIGFDKTVPSNPKPEPQQQAPSVSLPPLPSDTAAAKPPIAPSSAMQSFEQFMKMKKTQISDGLKSRTPNKVNPNTSAEGGNSARKKNRWQSADKTAESENKSQPPPTREAIKKLQLPVIHIYKITAKNPQGMKTRKVCPKRDGKLRLVLDALSNAAVLAQ